MSHRPRHLLIAFADVHTHVRIMQACMEHFSALGSSMLLSCLPSDAFLECEVWSCQVPKLACLTRRMTACVVRYCVVCHALQVVSPQSA